MAGAAYNKFNFAVQFWTFATGLPVSSGTWKAFLTNTAPTATYQLYSGLSSLEITGQNGYSSGGATLTFTTSNNAGTESVFWTAPSPTWTGTSAASTSGFGPFRYSLFWETTSSELLAWFDYGAALTIFPGDTLTLSSTSATNTLFTVA